MFFRVYIHQQLLLYMLLGAGDLKAESLVHGLQNFVVVVDPHRMEAIHMREAPFVSSRAGRVTYRVCLYPARSNSRRFKGWRCMQR